MIERTKRTNYVKLKDKWHKPDLLPKNSQNTYFVRQNNMTYVSGSLVTFKDLSFNLIFSKISKKMIVNNTFHNDYTITSYA